MKGVALVPFQNIPAAVAVNRAVTTLGLVGVTVTSAGLKEHLGEPPFWPIYEELQRLNTPLLIHNSRLGPPDESRFDTFLFMHTIGRPFSTMQDCAALMYGGVPEKFPRLRAAFLECGIGWVPAKFIAGEGDLVMLGNRAEAYERPRFNLAGEKVPTNKQA